MLTAGVWSIWQHLQCVFVFEQHSVVVHRQRMGCVVNAPGTRRTASGVSLFYLFHTLYNSVLSAAATPQLYSIDN